MNNIKKRVERLELIVNNLILLLGVNTTECGYAYRGDMCIEMQKVYGTCDEKCSVKNNIHKIL